MAMAPTKINNAKEALQAIKEISEHESSKTEKAYAVADYIKQKSFRTIVDKEHKAQVRAYNAALFNPGPGDIVSFQPTPAHAPPNVPIKAWFVPLVSVDRLITNKHQVPKDSLAIIDLAQPGQPPFICTQKLTGCCLVLGWDEKKGRLYLAHIEPSATHDRSFIAQYVRDNEVLPVPKSQLAKYICFGGDANELPSGYNKYTVNITGFILSTRIWVVFRFDYNKEQGSFMWDLKKV